jgi:hypothetical protein
MMTFREWAEKYCVDRGMWPEDARTVIDAVVADPVSDSMSGRWTHDVSSYPVSMMAVVGLIINGHAIAWIDANFPEAWFRPMFDPDQARKLGIG